MAINRNALKTYAPKARLDFIQATTNRAALFGITRDGVSHGQLQGEVYIVEGRPWPKAVAEQRRRLVARIRQTSFDQVMEAVSYTWFNRFLAIRYMELHDYFDHGFRVLSSPTSQTEPQILTEAAHLDLPGLKREEVVRMKLDGTQDEALYRKILIAQCNDLHRAMPFLFEKIEDETELLLPENLLQSDSIVRKLVTTIDEAEWDQIEIIGWLYQFYISDKKDQVIGKVVKSEDIPAATQLFTPNWIVKYMVQNSLGATWLGTYPDSAIKAQMEYYIDPAEQTPEVNAQLAQITPKALDPEELTLIDPACGSGHILVEAYDLFKAIYIERGYSAREAARLILTKNLYGLDIDDRAAQMAGFALMMRARADDRGLLRDPPILNIRSLQESNGLNADSMIEVLLPTPRIELIPSNDLLPETLAQPTLALKTDTAASDPAVHAIRGLLEAFKDAKTYGSLITIPADVMASLPLIGLLLEKQGPTDLLRRSAFQDAADALQTLLQQAKILGQIYNCVVANPPYMGGKGLNEGLKTWVGYNYDKGKSDLFAAFILRAIKFSKHHGICSFVTLQNWMFLISYEELRNELLDNNVIKSMVQIGYNSFPTLNSKIAVAVMFSFQTFKCNFYEAKFFNCNVESQSADKQKVFENLINDGNYFTNSSEDFESIPNRPIAYWVSEKLRTTFRSNRKIENIAPVRQGFQTGDNDKFLRLWSEVSWEKIGLGFSCTSDFHASGKIFAPYNKGGEFRKWYGNNDYVVFFDKENFLLLSKLGNKLPSKNLYFKKSITWSSLSSGDFGARSNGEGFTFSAKGACAFPNDDTSFIVTLAVLNSNVCSKLMDFLSATLDFNVGSIRNIPIPTLDENLLESLKSNVSLSIQIAKWDWDTSEFSWDFSRNVLLNFGLASINQAYSAFCEYMSNAVNSIKNVEEENNKILVSAYGLEGEISTEVPVSGLSLRCNPENVLGSGAATQELAAYMLSGTMRDFISYAVGCMMGRYSLAEPGLIYAHSGNEGFDPLRYGAFPADGDGIIPITEDAWFDDDVAQRFEEFLGVAWPESPVADNLAFLVEGLIKCQSDDPRGDLRDYLSKKFYSDHLQTYKNRPIYWLFSSGKLKAFECLVYLHRYNEGTLARMRTEYVTPLMGKMTARIEGLEQESAASSSSADKAAKTRAVTKLRKQLEELRAFDEELHHLADQRIALDLDDGVKVNYGRFGNLLAFKTKVCGKDESE
jgi:type II restriction/modification system DNA methylase subunit YeeA